MATNLTSWYPELRGKVPGVPPPVLLRMVRASVREFCEKTLLWKKTLDEIDVVADTQSYALAYSGAELIEIRSVQFKAAKADGTESDDDQFHLIHPATEELLDKIASGAWEFQECTSPSNYYTNKDVNTIYLTEIPTVASTDGLRAKVWLKPDEDATTVEDLFWNKYRDAITEGAAYRLFNMTAMPWASTQLADRHEARFLNKCYSGTWDRHKGGVRRSMRVRPVKVF